ncbi:MAG: di-heme oxidoredictase family protein, partial [Candidatus Latescibacterota bacterium]|nr:di-heme oxidoredictase family protein [Candidatus Latescibacterota bacterium]
MRRHIHLLLVTAAAGLLGACDTLMTETPPAGDEFAAPLDGLDQSLNAVFLQGDENFEKSFSVAEGLGPIFNNVSCEGCHPGDGRGSVETGFFRFSAGGDLLVDAGGPQHQDKVIPGIRLVPEGVPAGVDKSFRLPLPVFGVGLIEAIPEQTIIDLEDPDDADGDGISGRVNWVTAADFVSERHVGGGSGVHVGRFSRKAQVSSLLEQVSEAY